MATRNDSISTENMNSTYWQFVVAICLVAMIVAARILPHEANFTPVAAVGLFSGIYLRRKWALAVPIVGLVISDLFLTSYPIEGRLIVYGSFFAMGIIGRLISRGRLFGRSGKLSRKLPKILGGTLAGSIVFFIVTNNVFLYTPALYTYDASGMMASYVAGLPFFRSQLMGDLFYSGILVVGYELFRVWLDKRELSMMRYAIDAA